MPTKIAIQRTKEIKDKMALCVSEIVGIIDDHHKGKEECPDIFEDLNYILGFHDLHMEDFTQYLDNYPTVKYKLAEILAEQRYDRGLFTPKKNKGLF